jgi:hypothetical protein
MATLRPWLCAFDMTYFTEDQAEKHDYRCPRCGGSLTSVRP